LHCVLTKRPYDWTKQRKTVPRSPDNLQGTHHFENQINWYWLRELIYSLLGHPRPVPGVSQTVAEGWKSPNSLNNHVPSEYSVQ